MRWKLVKMVDEVGSGHAKHDSIHGACLVRQRIHNGDPYLNNKLTQWLVARQSCTIECTVGTRTIVVLISLLLF